MCQKSPIGNPWKNLPGNPFFWGFMVIFVMQKSRVLVNFSYDKKEKERVGPEGPTLNGCTGYSYRLQ